MCKTECLRANAPVIEKMPQNVLLKKGDYSLAVQPKLSTFDTKGHLRKSNQAICTINFQNLFRDHSFQGCMIKALYRYQNNMGLKK